MVEIISKENASLYEDVLDDMFRMRYRVAVGQWGWRIPNIEIGYDKDDYDRADTVYFVCLDVTETHVVACGRLNPTTGPHLLRDVFSHHCQFQDVPVGPDIYELSRYVVDRDALTKDEAVAVRARIAAAFNLVCLESGIKYVSLLTYLSSYSRTLAQWPTRPLGPAIYYPQDKAAYIAALCEMLPEGVANIRRTYGLRDDEPHLSTRMEGSALPTARRLRAQIANESVAA